VINVFGVLADKISGKLADRIYSKAMCTRKLYFLATKGGSLCAFDKIYEA
jgi:hypothetical protein